VDHGTGELSPMASGSSGPWHRGAQDQQAELPGRSNPSGLELEGWRLAGGALSGARRPAPEKMTLSAWRASVRGGTEATARVWERGGGVGGLGEGRDLDRRDIRVSLPDPGPRIE
jgi:hypothetical protein